MEPETFGKLADGRTVDRVTITGGGLTARIMTWGAVVQDLRLEGHDRPLVLGFEAFDPYPAHSPYFGAIVGRYANRIGNARFAIDGRICETDRNFLGKHTLHGGSAGIGKTLWTLKELGRDFVSLTYRADDGEMGFPGNLDITCNYSVKSEGRLVIELSARSDAPTLCNLAHHSYFNLNDGGRSDARDHMLQIDADAYLPVDAELIPTGTVLPVDGTIFDFRSTKPIRNGEDADHTPYDHNFCLAAAAGPLRQVAILRGQRSGVEMTLRTTEPGLQFYDGAHVAREQPGLGRTTYAAHAGICLEPQIWPDAPNRRYFPQALLRPGDQYHQITEYAFTHSV